MALLAYNRKKQFLAPDVEGLIKQLTGFEEDDKNFQEVARFVYSNLIHHNFATVDINAVEKTIDGIVQKFKIHGLNDRGRRLEELVQAYVSSDSSHHSQLNVQWYVLLLLLRLAYRPTNVSEEALEAVGATTESSISEEHQQDINTEDINWSEYLREGWEEFQCHSDNSDEDEELWSNASGDEEVAEPPPCGHLLQTHRVEGYETMGYGVVPHPSLWRQPPSLSRQEAMRKMVREVAQSEQWLRGHVQSAWWSDYSFKSVSESKYTPAHMCEIWEKCMATESKRESLPILQTHVVSEHKVLQEVLWMLLVSDTSLFNLDDDGLFCVKPNLSLPTTIPDTLQLVLEDLCPYFNMINKLRRFEEELSDQEMSESRPPVTYKAYCAALFQQLQKFSRLVIDIETKLNKQEETMTLISVMEELTPGLNMLHYLFDIHTRAIVDDYMSQPPWLSTTRLLSVLYEALLEASDQMYVEASLHIFIHSFHVYLNIIDVWLSEGRLEDWREEFLIIREAGSLVVMPYEEEMRKCGVVPVSLLSKLVIVVRDAGYTMEVVSQLNKLTELRETVLNKGCLFKEFSENIYNEIKRLKENIRVKPAESEESTLSVSTENSVTEVVEGGDTNVDQKEFAQSELETCNLISSNEVSFGTFPRLGEGQGKQTEELEIPRYLLAISNRTMYDHMLETLLDNPLLTEALRSYCHRGTPPPQQPTRSATPQPESTRGVSVVELMSMHTVLEKQLELIVRRHSIASRLVTQTLRKEYKLLQHFTVMRNVFFMEAGNLAQSFYSYLFKEIESGTWNNTLSLSVQLQLCVEEHYPGFGSFFTVLVGSGHHTNNVHHAIPAISLAYRVDWPVSSVITPDMIDSYNKVFRFLLHLKYAFWTLHNIRFSDLYSRPNSLRVRRLHVLKLWMYHSTNTLHGYFMGQVLRSYSAHLEESIQEADSIDVIIQAHNKFLDEVKMYCLQNKKCFVETFIMKLLRMCSSLANHWVKEAAGSLTDADMVALETSYTKAYMGLVHCLEAVTGGVDAENFLCELKYELAHSAPDFEVFGSPPT